MRFLITKNMEKYNSYYQNKKFINPNSNFYRNILNNDIEYDKTKDIRLMEVVDNLHQKYNIFDDKFNHIEEYGIDKSISLHFQSVRGHNAYCSNEQLRKQSPILNKEIIKKKYNNFFYYLMTAGSSALGVSVYYLTVPKPPLFPSAMQWGLASAEMFKQSAIMTAYKKELENYDTEPVFKYCLRDEKTEFISKTKTRIKSEIISKVVVLKKDFYEKKLGISYIKDIFSLLKYSIIDINNFTTVDANLDGSISPEENKNFINKYEEFLKNEDKKQ